MRRDTTFYYKKRQESLDFPNGRNILTSGIYFYVSAWHNKGNVKKWLWLNSLFATGVTLIFKHMKQAYLKKKTNNSFNKNNNIKI